MLETFRKAFQIKDIRKKIGYTFLMLIVIRIGSELPTPGVDPSYIKDFFAQNTGEAFNLFNAFTGGSFEQMSVFALSITPYITSSIIMQLLTIAIPKLEEMQKEGEDGRKKIVAITRYLTVALALIESTAMAVGFGRRGLLVEYNFVNAAIVVLTLTAGSALLMWIGERITEKGVGNGISIVLVINIISRIPNDMSTLFEQFVKGKPCFGRTGSSYHLCDHPCAGCICNCPSGRREKDRSPVLTESSRKKNIRRSVHTHTAEDKYRGCYTDHLRILTDAVPDRDRVFPRERRRHGDRQ